jgi:hypothetical protein
MLGKTYKDYEGESIATNIIFRNGLREQESVFYKMDYQPNSCPNAIVCGNGKTREKFFKMLELVDAAGGYLRKNKPEVYACNAAYTETTKPHNVIIGNPLMADEFYKTSTNYPNAVYLPWAQWVKYKDSTPTPRLVPNHYTGGSTGKSALYLAAWHGHTTIYMIGFDLQPEEGRNNNIYAGKHPLYSSIDDHVSDAVWIADCLQVIRAYPDVKFVRIVPTVWDDDQKKSIVINYNCPDEWADCDNFRQLDVETFKQEIDFGPVKDHTRKQLQYRSAGPRVS